MLNNPLPEILPALMRLGVGIGGWLGGEDIGSTERRAVLFGDEGPAHEFWHCEKLEEGGFFGDEGVAGVGVDAVEEIGLFVVVRGENYIEDYALEGLEAENR